MKRFFFFFFCLMESLSSLWFPGKPTLALSAHISREEKSQTLQVKSLLSSRWWQNIDQLKALVSLLALSEKQEKSSPQRKSLPYKSHSLTSAFGWPRAEATCFCPLLYGTESEKHRLLETRKLLLVLRCPCFDLAKTLEPGVMWYLLTCKPLKRESLRVRQDNSSSAPEP